ncbi:MAG: DUF4861 family protein, partial [Candidatus Sumerlaeota bacterium]|nr:DUF4861 family protein [Candidatus Sumerlaeota bacterium]
MRTRIACFRSTLKAAPFAAPFVFAAIIAFAVYSSFPAGIAFAAENRVIVTAANPLDIKRANETIVLSWKEIAALLPSAQANSMAVTDEATKGKLISQAVDMDGDGASDDFIFQSDFQPNETKRFILSQSAATSSSTQSTSSTKSTSSTLRASSGSGSGASSGPRSKVFARFAPDKLYDFAWENDRIAFRMYGPAKQKLALRG